MSVTKDQILDAIAEMSVMDVVELVEAMEEKFGVTAAAAVVAAGPAEAAEEQTSLT
jgi:large subunit ribosomal protein L7/L12